MQILVLNCGSSSIKYTLFEMTGREVLGKGLLDRIGDQDTQLEYCWRDAGTSRQEKVSCPQVSDHHDGLELIMARLQQRDLTGKAVHAICHRVVHGGDRFTQPVLVDDEVEAGIEAMIPLAPLHNPANLEGIRAMAFI